ncbi:MAG: hypothetical protein KDE55_16470 [Novosphingobium sp.]|nr:hypothetical protein [Novosphingobium sp.]
MRYDDRFALIHEDGAPRYAQLLDGTFQVGKEREATPTDLATFARAVLLHQKGGRFTSKDGKKHGILGYGGRARATTGYILCPQIAAQIGVPPRA